MTLNRPERVGLSYHSDVGLIEWKKNKHTSLTDWKAPDPMIQSNFLVGTSEISQIITAALFVELWKAITQQVRKWVRKRTHNLIIGNLRNYEEGGKKMNKITQEKVNRQERMPWSFVKR